MKRSISRNDRMNEIEILKMAKLIDDSEQSISQNISQHFCQNSKQQVSALNYVHQYYSNPYLNQKQDQIRRKQKVLCNQFIQLDNNSEQKNISKIGSKYSRLSKKEARSQNTKCTSAPKTIRQRKSVEQQQGLLKGILKNTSKSQQQIKLKPFFFFLEDKKKKVTFKKQYSQDQGHEIRRKRQNLTNASLSSSPHSFMHQRLFFQELSQS